MLNVKNLPSDARQVFVIPWGLEPQSKEPESSILSIELRNRFALQR